MAILDELLVSLGFEYDPSEIEQFNEDLDNTISMVKKLASALVVGTTALVGFTTATTAASDKQAKLSKQTGLTVGEIDSLQFALKRTGGQAESLVSSLEQFSIRISEAARGTGSGVEAFGILGVSITDLNGNLKPTSQLILEVSDALQGLDKAQQIELADKLGLKDSILLLQEGSEGIRQLTDEARRLGVTTAEDAALSEEFQDSLTNIFQIVKQLSRVITRSLVPVLENTAEATEQWWLNNREIIEQKLPEFIEKTTKVLKILTVVTGAFIAVKMIAHLLTLIKLFKSLSVTAALASAAIGIIPTLIAATIGAVALLAEDAKVFFEGGESFIGDMIEKYPQWADQIRMVAAIFATLADLTVMIFKGWGMIFDFFTSGQVLSSLEFFLKGLERDANEAFDNLIASLSDSFNQLWEDIKEGFNTNVIQPIEKAAKAISDFFSFGDEETTRNISTTVDALSDEELQRTALSSILFPIKELESLNVGNDLLAPLPNNSIESLNPSEINRTNSSSLSLGDINVEVSTNQGNPEQVGQIVGESIRRELEPIIRQASQDLNSVVEV